jgi:hypothetical protein
MVRLGDSWTINLSSFIAGSTRRPVAASKRVRGEVPEIGPIPSLLVRGPDLRDPRDASSWEDRVTVGIKDRSGEVGGCGGIADCHIDVPPDETAVGPGRSRVPGEGATGAKVVDRLPGADLEGCVVAPGFVAEVGDAGVVGRKEYEGLFGED